MRPEVLRLNEVIHDTVKLLKHLLQEDIKLRLDLDHELGNIKADPIQITQVMLNLALNARDAMPEGGLLEISTENFEVFLNLFSPPRRRAKEPGWASQPCTASSSRAADSSGLTVRLAWAPLFSSAFRVPNSPWPLRLMKSTAPRWR
jgi:hypothetical protein